MREYLHVPEEGCGFSYLVMSTKSSGRVESYSVGRFFKVATNVIGSFEVDDSVRSFRVSETFSCSTSFCDRECLWLAGFFAEFH